MLGSTPILTSALLLLSGTAAAASAPTAQTLNGTYVGVHSARFDQDFFLGMPYLQAPVDDRRFHPADSLTSSWNGTRNATAYAPSCVGYDTTVDASEMAEDCLYLNVIRPHSVTNASNLPVAVFIHGGDFSGGSASEQRYNLSFIVEKSVQLGQPIIAVSFNYRLSAWGFLFSNQLRDTGATNIGLRDQRFALTWIQENIAGFGGDPAKVTLWGQGTGASSVGFQITAYSGRNDSLFRAAIMQSGNPVPEKGLNGTQYYQPLYDAIAQRVNPSTTYASENDMTANDTCWDAVDRMACLRTVPFEQMNAAINATSARSWFPVIDGDIVPEQPSRSLYTGKKYLKVPIILGASTDEGSKFMPEQNITTEAEFVDLVANPQFYGVAPGIALPPILVRQLTDAYANVSSSPHEKALAYQGDAAINANRRQACSTWSRANISAYCYRFDVPLYNQQIAQHGNELPFVFANTDELGSDSNGALASLADDISSSWVSFIASLDPNAWRQQKAANASAVTPSWPKYAAGELYEMVFRANGSSSVEKDSWRATPIHLINGQPSGIAVAYQR
ncbi:carboxylesterase family protein-like protein [Aspergillus transmontanensis]|uniref:Carboxylesterase family protein-like protein n=1 Tax=Aspergillus transmontanensis TaxID=1034304 RepID=A0A5N6W9A8_9EURO|nr:carboxylesterase family protein-like protein [Aspergillus transmontanensis]KAE8317437.1 carboxylesterase family protein-like protein [Aspergillus transmontanensis]